MIHFIIIKFFSKKLSLKIVFMKKNKNTNKNGKENNHNSTMPLWALRSDLASLQSRLERIQQQLEREKSDSTAHSTREQEREIKLKRRIEELENEIAKRETRHRTGFH